LAPVRRPECWRPNLAAGGTVHTREPQSSDWLKLFRVLEQRNDGFPGLMCVWERESDSQIEREREEGRRGVLSKLLLYRIAA